MAASNKAIITAVLTAVLAVAAMPVQGYYQAHSFFSPMEKYRLWFHDTRWMQDPLDEPAPGAPAPAAKAATLVAADGVTKVAAAVDVKAGDAEAGSVQVAAAGPVDPALVRRAEAIQKPTSVKYPYPSEKFVMTDDVWRDSVKDALTGKPDWYDVEVVRQRAEVEEYAPAMNLLGWMYEHGRGVGQDMRRAYTMYERAKLAGINKLHGDSDAIFGTLTPLDQLVAEIQLVEDVDRLTPTAKPDISTEQVQLHVMKQARDPGRVRLERNRAKRAKRSQGLLGFAQ